MENNYTSVHLYLRRGYVGAAVAHHAAVGSELGTIAVPRVNYSVPGNYGGVSLLKDYSVTEEVRVVTLDSVFRAPSASADSPSAAHAPFALSSTVINECPSLVKVDVEGMELGVLQGGREMLLRCRPVLYVENNCRKDSPGLVQFIGGLGYDMFWDIKPYYNPANFFGNPEDIFTDKLLSMNILCIPTDSERAYRMTNFVKIRNDETGYYLHQYTVPWRGEEIQLNQLGDDESCVR